MLVIFINYLSKTKKNEKLKHRKNKNLILLYLRKIKYHNEHINTQFFNYNIEYIIIVNKLTETVINFYSLCLKI